MINVLYCFAGRHRPGLNKGSDIIVSTIDISKKCYPTFCIDFDKVNFTRLIDKECFNAYIFTPPCNYYSKANYRRETSIVAQSTKHLLVDTLMLCKQLLENDIPFLVENVQNSSLVPDILTEYRFSLGGHYFWSNVLKADDFEGEILSKANKQNVCRNKRDLNYVVDLVINRFLDYLWECQVVCDFCNFLSNHPGIKKYE